MTRKTFHYPTLAAFAALLLVSCSPSAYILDLESRGPSSSGIDLAGKSLAVVYLESPDKSDTLYNNRVSDALAYSIEQDLFDGNEAVSVYNMQKDPDGKYSSKDTLSKFIMMLDKDVVMLLDSPVISDGKSSKDLYTVSSKLYIYDSMADDDVVTLNSHASVSSLADADKALSIGTSLASPLKSTWVRDDLTIVYYDMGDARWLKAVQYADEMEWKEAITLWMDLALLTNPYKASCAKYNIAVGCYVLGQYGLALEWLESSDSSYPLPMNSELRTKVKSKMKA